MRHKDTLALRIDPDVKKAAKLFAARARMSLTDLVEHALVKAMKDWREGVVLELQKVKKKP